METFLLLFSGILVIWLIIGLGLFAAGMVRAKNSIDILVKTLAIFAIVSIAYLLFGQYITAASASEHYGFWPQVNFTMLHRHEMVKQLSELFFYLPLAAIPVLVVMAATAERLRLWPLLLFTVIMATLIFPVLQFWTWGQGFLAKLGFLDIAGAGVLHFSGAMAALSALLLLHPRHERYKTQYLLVPRGANMALSYVGMCMVWIGCFGLFWGGTLLHDPQMTMESLAWIAINNIVSVATSSLAVLIVFRIFYAKADFTFVLNGIGASLIAISAAPALYHPLLTIFLGIAAGILAVLTVILLDYMRLDDPVGAIAMHGVGGLLGVLAAASTVHHGQPWWQAWSVQILALAVIFAWVFVTSFVVWVIIRFVMGLRATAEEEYRGLDITEYGLVAYPEFMGL